MAGAWRYKCGWAGCAGAMAWKLILMERHRALD